MIVDATSLLTMLGLGALIVGVLIARLPVATCAQCPHCRASIREAASRQRRLREDDRRRAGIPPRLWGRRDDRDPGDDERP